MYKEKNILTRLFDYVKSDEKLIIEIRRELHRHPELSNLESNTIEYIKSKLDEWSIRYIDIPKGGILGYIEGAKEGRSLLLRADIDALPIQESEDNALCSKSCISENPGIMHACGHDAHSAMLLVASKIISEHREELTGNVWLMFERGEEGTERNFEHIFNYIEDNNIIIDKCYASHVYCGLESGKVGICDGPTMAGRISFKVNIHGRGGHGSRPDLCISPIDCFGRIYQEIMELADSYEMLTCSICQIDAGESENTIPDDLFFSGTARMFDKEQGEEFREKFIKILENETAKNGASFEADISYPSPAVNNDPELAAKTREFFGKVIGKEHVTRPDQPWMASESFALTMNRWPGVLAFIGIYNKDKGTGAEHHTPEFDIDEDTLIYGTACYAAEAFSENKPI